jgi:O-antigen/teichoic acid export membrane protein
MVVLGRALGPASFGVFSIVSAYVLVAGLLAELRMQDVVARDFCHADGSAAAHPDDAARLVDFFLLEMLSRLIPTIGLVILAQVLTRTSNLPPGSTLLVDLAALGFFASKSGWGTSTGLLRVMGRTDLIALFMAADWGSRLVLTALVALVFDLSVLQALAIAFISGGVWNIAQVLAARREFSRRMAPITLAGWSAREGWRRSRGAQRLIGANLAVSAADLMAKDLDVAMISSLLSTEKVGLYKLAKSFAQIVWRGIDPFYLAIMPEVRRLWMAHDHATLLGLLRKTSSRLLLLAIALSLLAWGALALLGPRVLGPGYDGLPSLMLTMCVWIVICAPLVWGHPLAVAINRPELAVAGGVLGSAIGLTAFWFLTPIMGLPGAAIAWSLTTTVGFTFIATTSLHSSRLLRSRS